MLICSLTRDGELVGVGGGGLEHLRLRKWVSSGCGVAPLVVVTCVCVCVGRGGVSNEYLVILIIHTNHITIL